MSQYEQKNWKKICEEKDAEIQRLHEAIENAIERIGRLREYESYGDCPKDGMCDGKNCSTCYSDTAIANIRREVAEAKVKVKGTGEWEDDHGCDVCSECGFRCDDNFYLGEANYCPECGSDMRGTQTWLQ